MSNAARRYEPESRPVRGPRSPEPPASRRGPRRAAKAEQTETTARVLQVGSEVGSELGSNAGSEVGSDAGAVVRSEVPADVRSAPVAPAPKVRAPRGRAAGSERRDRGATLAIYLDGVRRHQVMSRQEEHEVASLFHETRDRKLGDRLVNANLRLVLKIALEYRGARSKLADLVQEGNLGLLHALQKYDPHRGVKLASYAAWWIRAYILKFILGDARLVKLGTTQAQRRLFFGLRRTRARLEGQNGAEVNNSQLAKSLCVSEREVEEMERRMSSTEASLEWPSRDDDHRLQDCLRIEGSGPDVEAETTELRGALHRELATFRATLDGRELVLFEKRILCEETTTLAEIAGQFGVSRERVRQLEERLKARLRAHLRGALGDAVPGGLERSRAHEPADDAVSLS